MLFFLQVLFLALLIFQDFFLHSEPLHYAKNGFPSADEVEFQRETRQEVKIGNLFNLLATS